MIRRASLVLLATLAGTAACDSRDPCRRLADRDCALHGRNSQLCRDALRRADDADPFLVEVCRAELESGNKKP